MSACPCSTERLLMGRKESNQTVNKQNSMCGLFSCESPYLLIFKVGVHTIWCHFGQFKFVQKDHFQRNANKSYISI